MNNPAEMLLFHRFCLNDPATELYRKAILEVVRQGDVVLDLGAGTGMLAYFACLAGARKVYAIEMDRSIQLAKEIYRTQSFKDRIEFIHRASYEVNLPEKVDVIITNTFDCFGVEGGLLKSILDANERFLRDGGKIIPKNLSMYLSPVEISNFYNNAIDFWGSNVHGLDMSPIRSFATNNLYPVRINGDELIGPPCQIANITLLDVKSLNIDSEITLTASRPGIVHGLVGWFASGLTDDTILSNEPGLGVTKYAQAFLPLAKPIQVDQDDNILVRVQSYNGGAWRWQVKYLGQGTTMESSTASDCQFDHSTFWGFPFSAEDFHRRSSQFVPRLSAKGAAEAYLLELFRTGMTISEMEAELQKAYSDIFHSTEEIATFVRDIVARCCE